MLIDAHCHLSHIPAELGTAGELCARARAQGVHGVLSIATTPADLAPMQQACANVAGVWFAAGLHPEAVTLRSAGDLSRLEAELRALATQEVIALGETGLDYLDAPANAESAAVRALQRDAFALHLEVARQCDLPVIVHTRGAVADTLDVIRAHPGVRGMIHCFTEDEASARAFLALGFLLSFSGILTFRNAASLRAVAAQVDASMMLVETDAPWLAPMPMRGKTNQPAFVAHTAACLAGVRGTSVEDIAKCTTANFARLFGVSPAS